MTLGKIWSDDGRVGPSEGPWLLTNLPVHLSCTANLVSLVPRAVSRLPAYRVLRTSKRVEQVCVRSTQSDARLTPSFYKNAFGNE